MEHVIEVEQFSKNFGDLKAVDNISLKVKSGEVFCFLGTNGAGKTTTIKALTGQLVPSQGKLKVLGKDVSTEIDDVLKQIGVVGDFHCLYRNLTVRENLEFFCDLYEAPRKRVDEVIDQLQLNHKADSKVTELSKGLTQRALLGKSILHEPKILFLDEPSTGLDPISTNDLHKIVLRLKEQGTTVFLTTHFMEEAEDLADTVCFIHNGQIVESGTPLELKRKYGQNNLIVTYANETKQLPMTKEGIGQLVDDNLPEALSIHSQEASLKEIFIKLLSGDQSSEAQNAN